MTPFGIAVRQLRDERNISQKTMAEGLGVSPAYLSALEHGRRGVPSFDFLQRVAGYFNIIWDDADALFRIARLSHPKVTLDTAGLDPAFTRFANRLASEIRLLDTPTIEEMSDILQKAAKKRSQTA